MMDFPGQVGMGCLYMTETFGGWRLSASLLERGNVLRMGGNTLDCRLVQRRGVWVWNQTF